MSGSVRRRDGDTDTVVTWNEADTLAGRRLDRRRAYMIFDKEVRMLTTWSQACSNCSCDCGDGYPCGHGSGGCETCGHTGRSRVRWWAELDGAVMQ